MVYHIWALLQACWCTPKIGLPLRLFQHTQVLCWNQPLRSSPWFCGGFCIQYTRSQVSACIHYNEQKKLTTTKEKMEWTDRNQWRQNELGMFNYVDAADFGTFLFLFLHFRLALSVFGWRKFAFDFTQSGCHVCVWVSAEHLRTYRNLSLWELNRASSQCFVFLF